MCSDEDWWQARRVLSSGDEGEMGLVPSRTRWEKKVRARHRSETLDHKVRKYKEYHSVCPLVGIGTLPTPLSPASLPLPPEPPEPIPTTGEKA
jgi:hypothetical protein